MTFAADLRSAWRNVRRGGWLSTTVVLILAVGIAAVTAIFSIAHAVLIRPLPVADADRVVVLWGQSEQQIDEVRAMYGIGRLAPGAHLESATAELSTIAHNEELKKGMVNTSMSAYLPARSAARIDPVVALRAE